jgi:hypothetical protein
MLSVREESLMPQHNPSQRSALWKRAAEYERAAEARRRTARKVVAAAVPSPLPRKGNGTGNVTEANADAAELLASLLNAQRTVLTHFPQWKAVETLLAASASLLLKDVVPSLALFISGRGGCGKTTVVEMFSESPITGDATQNELIRLLVEQQGQGATDSWFLPRDRFTASSILSMYADPGTKKKELEDRALFRLAKHKVVVTAELSRVFTGGNDQERGTLFSILQQWLDGRGVVLDSGTHGPLGEKGDFSFVWIGATTPFQLSTWKVMSALGPRLLFYRSRSIPREEQRVSDDDYGSAVETCRQAVHCVTSILRRMPRRSLPWPKASREQRDRLHFYAQLAVRAQAFPRIESPDPNHIRIRLAILSAARALLYGRSSLDDSDLALAKHIARSSTPQRRGDILFALADAESPLTAYDLQRRTPLQSHWILNILQELKTCGVVEKTLNDKWKLSPPQADEDEGW